MIYLLKLWIFFFCLLTSTMFVFNFLYSQRHFFWEHKRPEVKFIWEKKTEVTAKNRIDNRKKKLTRKKIFYKQKCQYQSEINPTGFFMPSTNVFFAFRKNSKYFAFFRKVLRVLRDESEVEKKKNQILLLSLNFIAIFILIHSFIFKALETYSNVL